MKIENYTGVEIGSELDFDQALRQMGFDSTEQLATVTMGDDSVYTILSLGEQRIYGLEGTELEGDVVVDNPEYILKHWEELICCDAVSNSCWISIECETPGVLDFRLSDDMVLGSISEAVELLKGLEKSLEEKECPYSFWTGNKKAPTIA